MKPKKSVHVAPKKDTMCANVKNHLGMKPSGGKVVKSGGKVGKK